jgi:hypothetical protein
MKVEDIAIIGIFICLGLGIIFYVILLMTGNPIFLLGFAFVMVVLMLIGEEMKRRELIKQ